MQLKYSGDESDYPGKPRCRGTNGMVEGTGNADHIREGYPVCERHGCHAWNHKAVGGEDTVGFLQHKE